MQVAAERLQTAKIKALFEKNFSRQVLLKVQQKVTTFQKLKIIIIGWEDQAQGAAAFTTFPKKIDGEQWHNLQTQELDEHTNSQVIMPLNNHWIYFLLKKIAGGF